MILGTWRLVKITVIRLQMVNSSTRKTNCVGEEKSKIILAES